MKSHNPALMQITHVTYFYDRNMLPEEDHLQQYYSIVGWAEALQQRGHTVRVIGRFHKNAFIQMNGVDYYFFKDRYGDSFRTWQVPWHFLKEISRMQSDIVHLHHLSFSLQTFILRYMLPRKTAILIQHHGGVLPGKLKRFLFSILNRAADGFFFTTKAQGQEWFFGKKNQKKLLPVMEGATFFDYSKRDAGWEPNYKEREAAQRKTGLSGSPVWLWVGRLDDNKDPLTVLEGMQPYFKDYPQANLYMIYSDEKLEAAVKTRIQIDPILKNRVRLLGKIPHEAMKDYFYSASCFVLGSHYEGSGFALSEALRCGCIPVVTDIPSFRMMTDDGRLGALWIPGDPVSLKAALKKVMSVPFRQESEKCMEFFNRHLSFGAIAAKAEEHYRIVLQKRPPGQL